MYDAVIRRNADGEIRCYRMDLDWDGENSLFWWTDGNFGCDCNRGESFERAAGVDPDGDWPCGFERYSVLKVVLPDGREIPIDDPSPAPDYCHALSPRTRTGCTLLRGHTLQGPSTRRTRGVRSGRSSRRGRWGAVCDATRR